MNTPVPPTPPSSAALQNALPPAPSTGTIVQAPAAQTALQTGQLLAATVLSRTAPGQFLVQTDLGRLTLQTAANLANGSLLNLQIQTAGSRPQVLILPFPTQARSASAPTPAAAADTSSLTQGSTATATVLRPATIAGTGAGITAAPTASPGGAPSISTGAGLASGAGAVSGTTALSGNTAQVPAATTAAPSGPGAPSPASAPPSATAPLPTGTTFSVRILTVAPAGTNAQPSAAAGANTVTGTVTGTTPTGQTVVQTPIGEIALSSRTPLPNGTQITLQLNGTPQLPLGAGEPSSLLLSQQWESLRNAIAALQTSDPAAARALTQQVLPQAGGPMTTGMLFFLSAMMTGDVRRWMGEETMRALQRTGGNLIERLRQDIGEMRRMTSEPTGQEWRSYLIPILVGDELEQLKLFVRGEREADEDNPDRKGDIRFVIEVEFSRLGPFQFDGLTRDKTIDLMIRTREVLDEVIRDNIRKIFADSVSALGFTGTVSFQRSEVFELNPTQEIHAKQSGLTV